MKKLGVVLLLFVALGAFAQAHKEVDSGVITISGGSVVFTDYSGTPSLTFEEVIAGSPATVSVVIQGCMRGGTCDTLDTYTTVANSNRTITGAYDNYKVTGSWTGGTNVKITINRLALQSRLGTNPQVNADWNAVLPSKAAILNKPTVPTPTTLNVKDYGAVGHAGWYPACSITAGSSTLTCANATWVNQQITQGTVVSASTPICIAGAGTAGADHCTQIVNYDNAGHFTLQAAAVTTVSGRGAYWGVDDTAAIQAAVTACGSTYGGCDLRFPQGIYIVNGTSVTVPAVNGLMNSRVRMVGSGRATQLLGVGADQTNIITVASGGHPTTVEEMSFESFDYSQTGAPRHSIAIDILGGIGHSIERNYFGNVYHAILATSTFNNRIVFNRFYGAYDSCIKYVSGASAVIDTRVQDNEFGVCGGGGAAHNHGYALEQVSQGGGGSNWLYIINNDCEGTEWNGCWYLANTTNYVLSGNRTEVDNAIGDGSFATLYNKNSSGNATNNELSGGVTMDGGTVYFTNNNFYRSNVTSCALTYAAGGGIAYIIGNGSVSNMTRTDVCNDPSRTTRWINHLEGLYVSNAFHIYPGFGGSSEPSNVRKQGFYDLIAPSGGSNSGFGNALQGSANTAAQRLPIAVAGASFNSGDRLYNGYWGTGANGAENFGWVCYSGPCVYDGANWTSGTWRYMNDDQFIRQWGTAAPISGYFAVGDQVYNSNWNGTSTTVYKWLCTVGGNPGTWKAIYLIDPASPGALGGTTPASGAFTTLSASSTLSVTGRATLSGGADLTQTTQAIQGQLVKAAAIAAPNTITCSGTCTLQAWYKADALALADGASVATWTDSSGNGRTLSPTGTQAVYHTNIQNGKPGVQFTNTTTGKYTTASWTFSGTYSVVWVALKPVSYATDCQFISDSGLNNFHYPLSTATNWSMRNNGGSANYPSYTATGYPDDGKYHIVTNVVALHTNGDSYGFVDGTQVASNLTATLFRDWQGGLGLNLFSTCSATVGEVIVYSGYLDATARKQLEAYLGIKYGINATAAYVTEVQDSSNAHLAGVAASGKFDSKGASTGLTSMAFSATPTYDASNTNTFKMTLTANVTSSQLIGATVGQTLHFILCQDGTGGWTHAWPSNFTGVTTIGSTASKCNAQTFVFDGTNAVAVNAGVTNQ